MDLILITVLAICTLSLYVRTAGFDFVGYDDADYVYLNPHVQHVTTNSFHWALTAITFANWHPLTLLVYLVVSLIFGPSAAVFHLVNSLLHTINAVLLYALLRNCTGRSWAAFFTAILWAVHPLRVESVAWISELKDELCGGLFLCAVLGYVRYTRQRTVGKYGLVLALFVLALLAKPMAATLPGVLLLLDFWPLGHNTKHSSRWWRMRIVEKLPLLAFAIANLAFAVHTQRTVITAGSAEFPIPDRIGNALISTVDYLRDVFLPRHLAVFYPHPFMLGQSVSWVQALSAGGLLLMITCIVCVRLKAQPYLAVGWFWFLGMLVPVAGFVQVGTQSRADRYTYLPSIGITIAIVWLISDWAHRRRSYRQMAMIAGIVATAVLATGSVSTIGHWKDTRTLFEYARRVVPGNFQAAYFCSADHRMNGDIAQAVIDGRDAVTFAPKFADGHMQYGLALAAAGRLMEAADETIKAINIAPTRGISWDALGQIRNLQADRSADNHQASELDFRKKALIDFKQGAHLDPDDLMIADHVAYLLAVLGQLDEAINIWEAVVDRLPSYGQAQGELADALRIKGDLSGAVQHYRAALAIGLKNPNWESSLAFLIATNPQAMISEVESMVPVAKEACDQTNSQQAAALDAYAACLARVGRFDDAVAAAQQAVAQANADRNPQVAKDIQKRLARYQRNLAFVTGDQ